MYWCEKARKYMYVNDRHDMTLAVKMALSPNTTYNQSLLLGCLKYGVGDKILHFDTIKIYSCGKHCEKRRNCL